MPMTSQDIGQAGRLAWKYVDICRTGKSRKFQRILRRQFLELQTKKSSFDFNAEDYIKKTMYKTMLNPKQI